MRPGSFGASLVAGTAGGFMFALLMAAWAGCATPVEPDCQKVICAEDEYCRIVRGGAVDSGNPLDPD